VRRRLTIGEGRKARPDRWPDYTSEFQLDREQAPELLRMACDAALNQGDPESPAIWAPVHAWRALGQLGIAEAVQPLLAFLNMIGEDEDVATEELPIVFGLIGPTALPAIGAFLAAPSRSNSSIRVAASGLGEIALRHPPWRNECLTHLVRLLDQDAPPDDTGKGAVVSTLLDLNAVEAIDAIRLAFRRNTIDISIAGDVEDVEIELGLRRRRSTPAPRYHLLPVGSPGFPSEGQARGPAQERPHPAKIGRNDPCPCGSGKKYKKCCLP
jgi:SEC-C motif/PBS lyase HEAT-like repeat